ncbi:APC family permease [Dechloromonas sp. XY25]|uniref:APC family permease n=1 Tax=Dechloromonas hankyongensis TaxID=2908002 RepID=A0ABS9K191_9RHOO|nr:APC family permease [Dechloromonas hankyongensis]MCG2576931.1 APC family permease [Dechloromonas hankyongensis]
MSAQGGLAKGVLGTFESAIMGIAGTAPAFSVAVTTAAIVAAVGVLSVGSIFYCGLIMFGIMLAFFHLSKISPHAGAAYAWVGHVFGRKWGFFAGWGLLVASIFFMVSATIPAATSTLVLLAPDRVESTVWVTGTAAVWLTLVTIVVTKGIKHASYTQLMLTGVETAVVITLIAGAFVEYGGNPAHTPSLIWFSPFSFTPQLFATGALTAIFFYWGWDVTMNLSEETRAGATGQPHPASQGAFWAMVNLILFFIIMMIVVLIVLSDDEIAQANTNVLYAIANKLFPAPWSYLAVLSTILSTIGTIETQILQFSRSMYAMARDEMLHPRYSRIHPKWQTPWVATFVIWFLGVLLLFSSSYMPTVKSILESSILAIGFQICFYMSLAGFACAWHYRDKLTGGLYGAVSYVLWPLLAAAFMVFIALYSIPTFDPITTLLGIGGILVGFIPLLLGNWRQTGGARG